MTTITSESPPAPPAKAQRTLLRLFKAHFWPQKTWFIGGTLMAILSAMFSIGYVAVLDYVGNRLQRDIEQKAAGTAAPIDWIWAGIAAIVVLTIGRALSMYAMTLLNNTGVQRGLVGVQTVQGL